MMNETVDKNEDSSLKENPTRALKRVTGTLEDVSEELGLSDTEFQTAQKYLLASWKTDEVERDGGLAAGRGADNVAAACLILAAEKHGRPLHIDEVVKTWEEVYPKVGESFSKLKVGRAKKAVRKLDEVDVEGMMTVPDYIEEYGERIGAPEELIDAAKDMYDELTDDGAQIVYSSTPQGIAASILYFTARMNGLRLVYTQEYIEEYTKPTAVTIRNRYADIRDWFGEQMGMDPDDYKAIEQKLKDEGKFQIPDSVVKQVKEQLESEKEDDAELAEASD